MWVRLSSNACILGSGLVCSVGKPRSLSEGSVLFSGLVSWASFLVSFWVADGALGRLSEDAADELAPGLAAEDCEAVCASMGAAINSGTRIEANANFAARSIGTS